MNHNNLIQPLLTDYYQITMAYAYWKSGKHNDSSVFELFFRKNPFNGEFTIFAGLQECIIYLQNFRFIQDDVDYFKTVLPSYIEEDFYQYLLCLNTNEIKLYSMDEGSICFPREPLIRIEGPLLITQLIETTILSLINYPSLVATNSARYRIAAGKNIKLIEMGLRRAQGPDGAFTASKYAYLGGFDATSNVLSSKIHSIPIKGTHAHSFIMSFKSLDQVIIKEILDKNTKQKIDFIEVIKKYQSEVANFLNISLNEINEGELASFVSYAMSFPDSFFALLDTYDVLRSGIVNFLAVALSLNYAGYTALGVRIDSGDLAYLSREIYKIFVKIDLHFNVFFRKLDIMVSNDINEDIIYSLNEQLHNITMFGIGTKLVTCEKQPALGCVYKLVELNGEPCVKLSENKTKITIPFKKKFYRFYSKNETVVLDLMMLDTEPEPNLKEPILCRHPFYEYKRAYVKPEKIKPLLKLFLKDGKLQQSFDFQKSKKFCENSLEELRGDIKRHINPTSFKVSVSLQLYESIHAIWLKKTPIGNLE